ncbi:metal-dependent hydrolase [Crateriforma conspicua]|uniref:UPF0173 metal-dependent hydrolase Pan14r_31300 n=1 Tax=Crateriforma conspicua TaxID=2527996 RepID=A0A5C5YBX7_9PLAN|nr:metal-dependent hydrolase [Crateriforma conspicua]QDV65430.1 metal-dependent hydrolase [Crateriforma conspicua]TWT70822.1 metal-dependent hydrolase [Crateriforma conspicua]
MTCKLTWLSHGTWLIESGKLKIMLDPFLTDNPTATAKSSDFDDVNHILVSHGHGDHVGDLVDVAQRSGAMVVASFELVNWLGGQGIENASPMNIGGQIEISVGEDDVATVKMVPAIHSSGLPDGSYGGPASGFVIGIGGRRIYFACDTAYYSDMDFYAGGVDAAVLPIGDCFTMGIDDSIAAVKRIGPKCVLPAHYNTWPPIAQDADAWSERVKAETDAEPVVPQIGQAFEI